MAGPKHITHVEVCGDGALLITCDACDYGATIPIEQIRLPLGDCQVGMELLRVVFHVEHVENGIDAKELV